MRAAHDCSRSLVARIDWRNPSGREFACRAILKRANWDLRDYVPGDEQEVLQLCRRLFGFGLSSEEWRWRMFQNPAGQAVSSVAFLKQTSRIVGHLAAIPMDLKVGDVTRKLFFLVDSVVDPVSQGRGIHAALTMAISKKVSDENAGFIGGLPNTQAYHPNLKLGGTQIFTMPIYFKVLDWRAVVSAGLHSKFLARLAGFLPFRRTRPIRESASFVIRNIPRFDRNLDDLWNRLAPRFGICAKRASDLLNWRYFECPESVYTVFSISSGNNWLGYVVVRLLDKWGLRLGTIVDLFVDPDCVAAGKFLLQYADSHFRDNGAGIVWGLFACPRFYRKILRQACFWRAPQLKGVRQFHFVADFVTIDHSRPDLYQRDGGLLRQEDQWFFSLGDTDLA